MFLKSRASINMLPFRICNKKCLAIRHKNGHLSFKRHYQLRPTTWKVRRFESFHHHNVSFVFMCVCFYILCFVCVCVCARARTRVCSSASIHYVVVESNRSENEKFCTTQVRIYSCCDGNEYLYQMTRRNVNHPCLTNWEIKEREEL
jgi:hypothetical protein